MHGNPFEYEQAHLIPEEMVARYYIDDHRHSRLLRSPRNIFLIGERGSGKTMASHVQYATDPGIGGESAKPQSGS